MSPFISQPMDDHKEKEAVPEGKYTLRIADYKVFYDDDQVTPRSLMIVHEIDGEPDAKPVMHFLGLANPNKDTEHSRYWKLAFAKGYCRRFGVSWGDTGLDPDSWMGATADVNLVQAYRNDDPNDVINQFAEREISPVT